MKRGIIFITLALLFITGTLLYAQVKKPKSLTIMIDTIQRDPDGLTEWLVEYEKITGIKLEASYPPHNEYPQKLRILLASGEKLDVFEILTGDYSILAQQKVLYPIDKFIQRSALMKSVNKKYLEACRANDGKIYGFPLSPGSGCVAYIRQDWLNKLGLKIPTTWNELYAVLQAFTTKDPDGNGKNDTFGYTLSGDVPVSEFDYYNRLIMQNARFDFMKKGKVWVDGFTEKEMVTALERWRKIYKEGLVDQEFFTNKTSTARSKFTDGKVGIFEYWAGLWAYRMAEGAKTAVSTANVVPIPPIKEAKYIERMGGIFGISAKSKNAEAAFKYWDEFMVDKAQGQTLFVYGVKGVHYDIVDGAMKMLPKRSNPKEIFEKAYYEPEFVVNDWKLPVEIQPALRVQSKKILSANSELVGYVFGGDNYAKYSGEIWKLKQQIFSKIVIGELSIEEGMAQYKSKGKELKLDDVVKELNAVSK